MDKAKSLLESYLVDLQGRRELIHVESCKLEARLEGLRKELAQVIQEQSEIYRAIKTLADEEDINVQN